MQEINPLVKEHTTDSSNYLNDVNRIYNKGIEEGKQRVIEKGNIRIVPSFKRTFTRKTLCIRDALIHLDSMQHKQKMFWTVLEGQTRKTVYQ